MVDINYPGQVRIYAVRFRVALSKKDIIVTICCIVFLLANLAAIGSSGRKRAKRAICFSNLRRLTLAWNNFADDNQGKIPGSDIGYSTPSNPSEMWWIGYPDDYYDSMSQCDAISDGVLWPYVKEP